MRTSDFDYPLPPELIAQTPAETRDHSRLMVVSRREGRFEHRRFYEIGDYLDPGDVLVANDSRVLPARLSGRKMGTGAQVELLLLRRLEPGIWEALARPARRLGVGTEIELAGTRAQVREKREKGIVVVHLSDEGRLEGLGTVPLPPYIHHPLSDPERYQTVYSRMPGSVAAPTAGLHFTPGLMEKLRGWGVGLAFITLHLGLDSFRPIQAPDPREHTIHREHCQVRPEVARMLSEARARGGRIVAVGTSTARALEEAARAQAGENEIAPFSGWTDLYILPGHRFQAVDALITNFHLPRSTLLLLVSAFAGRELVLRAYQEAIARGYRFYSFGDCMLVL